MMEQKITEDAVVQADSSQVSTEVDGEAVILNLKDGLYYGLNPVGARIWSLIQEPVKVSQVEAILLSEYEVEPDVCRSEVLALLDELAGRGLIQVADEGSAG